MNMVGCSLGRRAGWRMEVAVTYLTSSPDGEVTHTGDTEPGEAGGSAGKREARRPYRRAMMEDSSSLACGRRVEWDLTPP